MNNQHQNFLGTFHSRMLMVKRVWEEGVSVREVVAGQFWVSRQRVHDCLARYERGRPGRVVQPGLPAS